MPGVNFQALVALGCFLLALVIARAVNNINSGKWPGGQIWVTYLRILLGFVFAAAITFAFYAFAGVDILRH